MRRRGFLLLLAATLALTQWRVLAAPAAIANVRVIVHRLAVAPPHRQAAAGRVQQPLFPSYELRTAAPDRASLAFADRSVLHMNHDTDLVLRSAKLTTLSRGEVAINDAPGAHHSVQSASAVAAAIGTLYDVRIGRIAGNAYAATPTPSFPAGTTTVSVVTGTVRVQNRFGTVTVQPGEWTHVAPGKAPTRPTKHNARQDVAWTSTIHS